VTRSVGYVLKHFPRLSQTFVLRELLEHQAQGAPIQIYSCRRSRESDHHPAYQQLHAPHRALSGEGSAALTRELVAHAASARIGHLHAHFAGLSAEVAASAAAELGISFSVTAHARDIFLNQLDRDLLRARLSQARFVVTISRFHVDYLVHEIGLPPDRVRLIYNGVPLQELKWVSAPREAGLIVTVGRLIEKKGFADLIDAIAWLQPELPQLRLVIVGDGPEHASLQQRVVQHGLQANVTLTGALPPSETLSWIGRASVLAAPCCEGKDGDRDGLPTVLLEAMALGTPCVATPVTGIPEAIEHERTGLLVPARDPSALAGAIARLQHDPQLAARLAEQARGLVEQRFDLSRNAAQLRQAFEA
jgi:glycosyltransferase involved in cell wall biosynthesis